MLVDGKENLYTVFRSMFDCVNFKSPLGMLTLMKCVCKTWRRLVYVLLKDEVVSDVSGDERDNVLGEILCELGGSHLRLPVQCVIFQFHVYGIDFNWRVAYTGKPVFTIMEYRARVDTSYFHDFKYNVSGDYDKYVIKIKLRLDSTGEEFTSIAAAMLRSRQIEQDNGIDVFDKEAAALPPEDRITSRHSTQRGGLHAHVVIVVPSVVPDIIKYYHGTTLASAMKGSAYYYYAQCCKENDYGGFKIVKERIPKACYQHNVADGCLKGDDDAECALFDNNNLPCVDVGCICPTCKQKLLDGV